MPNLQSKFVLDDTQTQLCDALARYLGDHYDFEQRRQITAAPLPPASHWQGIAGELGIVAAAFPEAVGGMGGSFADHLVIMETLGRYLAAEPYLGTAVLAGRALQHTASPAATELLRDVIAGRHVVAYAHSETDSRHDVTDVHCALSVTSASHVLNGRKAVVHNAPWASHLLVSARSAGQAGDEHGLDLLWLPANTAGITRRDYRTRDGGVASEIRFDNTPVSPAQRLTAPGGAFALLQRLADEAALALCAEAVGVTQRLLHDTIDYARQRRQFGTPLAGFQAVQHRIADMHMAAEQLAALTWSSVAAIDAPMQERARAISSAKVCAGRACRIVSQGAVQIHGGMGMTEELAVGHYFRRATQIEQMFGSTQHHLRRIAQLTARTAA